MCAGLLPFSILFRRGRVPYPDSRTHVAIPFSINIQSSMSRCREGVVLEEIAVLNNLTVTGWSSYKSQGSVSAYKTHDRDPLFFSEGLKLVWRNGEDTVGCGDMQHCPAQYCPPTSLRHDTVGTLEEQEVVKQEDEGRKTSGDVAASSSEKGWVPAVYTSTVWVYEWPTQSSAPTVENDATQQDSQWLNQLRDSGLLDNKIAERAQNVLRRSDDETARRLLAVVRAYRVQGGDAARANGARQVARVVEDGSH